MAHLHQVHHFITTPYYRPPFSAAAAGDTPPSPPRERVAKAVACRAEREERGGVVSECAADGDVQLRIEVLEGQRQGLHAVRHRFARAEEDFF